MRNPEDYIGKRFGHITIIGGGELRHRMLYMLGRCDCGKVRYFQIPRLLNQTRSCGCMNRYKHGYKTRESSDKLYGVWCGIKQRCFDKNREGYNLWGGRGITICDEWKDNFNAFHDWAIAAGYKEGLSIDRINVNGNYEPSNCRWATQKEQARNTRKTIYLYYDGEKYPLGDLAEKYGIQREKLWRRLFILKWDLKRALET